MVDVGGNDLTWWKGLLQRTRDRRKLAVVANHNPEIAIV